MSRPGVRNEPIGPWRAMQHGSSPGASPGVPPGAGVFPFLTADFAQRENQLGNTLLVARRRTRWPPAL